MKAIFSLPLLLLALGWAGAPLVLGDVQLTEFLSRNETSAKDENGRALDWIEITNFGAEAVDLEDWALTDDAERPRRWRFPAGTVLAAGERRLVFASGFNRRDPEVVLHTNFRLSAAGDYVALVDPDGEVVTAFEPAPQFDDRSFGLNAERQAGYLVEPTPEAPNAGLALPGPVISEVTHAPEVVQPRENITVTARVVARQGAVASVMLHHRVDHNSESSVAMVDDGSGLDVEAGDGVYTAEIKGTTLFGPRIPAGSVARWYVTAEDGAGQASRFPPFLDTEGIDQSAEYLGALVAAEIETDLPVIHWYTDDESGSRSRRGARASVVYGGRFYDNIYVRQRGGATNGQSQKFIFNRAYPIYVNEELSRVSELNFNAQGSDATYLRQPLAFESYRWAGNASCLSFLTLMQLNGELDRTGVLIEQVDDDFLERNGFDPLGDLYKLVQRSNLNPVFADVTTGVEKKTGDASDFSSLQELVDGLALEGAERRAYLMDALNLPQVMNYLAVRSITQDADDVRKNFYVYQDTLGNGEWSIFPWDKDWTFGVTGDGGPHLKHPFFGSQKRLKTNANQWNRLYDALFTDSVTQQMYLRRLRTLAESLLQTEDRPLADRRYENRVDEMFVQAEGDVPNSGPNVVKRFFPERREDLFVTYSRGGREALLPETQEDAPPIEFGEILASPDTGTQDHEYIQLINPNRVAIDLSGWTLEGGVRFEFAEGTVIPAGSLFTPGINQMYLSPNVVAFRSRPASPTGGEGHFVQGNYEGHLSNLGETLVLKNREGAVIAEMTYEGNPSDIERYLGISEIMYHPSEDRPDTEFVELVNLSEDVTLDLSGVAFTEGIAFTFPQGVSLEPGETLLVVQDEAAFVAVYGEGLPVAGAFERRLANGGETLKLEDVNRNTILEFRYDDEEAEGWPVEADGGGPSLEGMGSGERPDYSLAENWRASAQPGGSPGSVNGAEPPLPSEDFQDRDGDGWVALLEEAFGTSDEDPQDTGSLVDVFQASDGAMIIRTGRGNADLVVTLELSQDLTTWTSAAEVFEVVEVPQLREWRSSEPVDGAGFRALRFRVER